MKPIALVLALLAMLLAGCQVYPMAPANPPPPPTCEDLAQREASPENLPFDTIARESAAEDTQLWPENKPTLVILTASNEIADIEPYIRAETATALRNVDFGAYLVVAVFVRTNDAGWQFCVTSVTGEAGEVLLHTHLIESYQQAAILASYYHLVRLPRENLPSSDVTFVLALTHHRYVNPTGRQPVLETSPEEIVASVTRSLP